MKEKTTEKHKYTKFSVPTRPRFYSVRHHCILARLLAANYPKMHCNWGHVTTTSEEEVCVFKQAASHRENVKAQFLASPSKMGTT